MPAVRLVAVLLFAANARASRSSDGVWDIPRSLHGCAGVVGQEAVFALGEATLSRGPLGAGSETILGGYLSQIPSLAPSVSAAPASCPLPREGVCHGHPANAPIVLLFSNEMAAQSLAAALDVTALRGPMSEPLSSHPGFSISASSSQSTLAPSGGSWAKGTLYAVTLASAAADINGLTLGAAATYYFATPRDHRADNTASASGEPELTVAVPAGAFPEDYLLLVATGVASSGVRDAMAKLKASAGPDRQLLQTVQVDPFLAPDRPWSATPARPVTLTMPYADADADGIVDRSDPPVRAKTLGIWTLDEANNLWVKQPGASVDTAARRVAVSMSHFSIDGMIATQDTDVSDAYAFPVPFRPDAGNEARYGSWATGIRFANLPAAGTIRIYSVSGVLVRELVIASNPQAWDARTAAGQRVANGVYLWEVKAYPTANRKTGRLVIAP